MCRYIDVKIFQYNVTFGLYMLDPWERWLFNSVAFSLIALMVYSSYVLVMDYLDPDRYAHGTETTINVAELTPTSLYAVE